MSRLLGLPTLYTLEMEEGVAESKKSQKMQFPALGVQGWPLDGVDLCQDMGIF